VKEQQAQTLGGKKADGNVVDGLAKWLRREEKDSAALRSGYLAIDEAGESSAASQLLSVEHTIYFW
jgi:hypothetical protein